jgi:hypothetical protein
MNSTRSAGPLNGVGLTLTIVQRIFPGSDGEEISQLLEQLPTHPNDTILLLINNRTLISLLEDSIDAGKLELITLYENLSNKKVLTLIKDLVIDGVELKKNILAHIGEGAEGIYKQIELAIETALETRANNTSIVYLSADNVKRTEAMEDLNINSFKFILHNFRDFEALDKESSSNSVIFTAVLDQENHLKNSIKTRGTLLPIRLFFKVFPTGSVLDIDGDMYDHETTLGLRFEQFAYNQLFKLTKYNVLPNILCKVAVSNATGFGKEFLNMKKANGVDVDVKDNLIAQIGSYNLRYRIPYDTLWNNTGIIITQPGGKKLDDELEHLSSEDARKVMFQLFYTLYIFEQIQFSHGDLHLGNIFVVDVPETELCYIVGIQQFRFKTTKLVKIYDFDQGTLCKDTTIKINTDKSFKITHGLNRLRDIDDDFFNQTLAETNIFNKNLDIMIFCNFLESMGDFPDFYDTFQMYGASDPEFDQFFREIFPGFDSANPVSQVTIRKTYNDIIAMSPDELLEANRIFGITIPDISQISQYKISELVLNLTWIQYFKKIGKKYGRIVKNFTKPVKNNHLWIPDTIIIPKLQMFEKDYFLPLRSTQPIDIRKTIVYSIENRIL